MDHRLLAPWCEREGQGSIAKIAKAAGISWPSAQAIVRFGSIPRFDRAAKIANLVGLGADVILEESRRCHGLALPEETDQPASAPQAGAA